MLNAVRIGRLPYNHLRSKILDIREPAKLRSRIEQRRRSSGNSVSERSLKTVVLGKIPNHRSQKAVTGAHDAGRFDRQTVSAEGELPSNKEGSTRSQAKRYDFNKALVDETTAGFNQRRIVGRLIPANSWNSRRFGLMR